MKVSNETKMSKLDDWRIEFKRLMERKEQNWMRIKLTRVWGWLFTGGSYPQDQIIRRFTLQCRSTTYKRFKKCRDRYFIDKSMKEVISLSDRMELLSTFDKIMALLYEDPYRGFLCSPNIILPEIILANRGRVRILALLVKEGELNITAIRKQTKVDYPQLSQALDVFKATEIVEEKNYGRIKIYRLKIENPLARAIKKFFDFFEEFTKNYPKI